ncbi:MAG: amylo-alpha-1,6-glucosidase [Isosphaeraceae bacterium]|nr:amylo-alpha-1,6-glucosidase [Isosphaeraceae bacterium]
MFNLVRSLRVSGAAALSPKALLEREWLVTNGLGGYASGTVSGIPTRRYHGLLIAALTAPLGRTLMLAQLSERLALADGTYAALGFDELAGDDPVARAGIGHLTEFRLEGGLPVWEYEAGGVVLEKRLVLPYLQNTAVITFRRLSAGEPVRLYLRPLIHMRSHDGAVSTPHPAPYRVSATDEHYEVAAAQEYPPLRLVLQGPDRSFVLGAETAQQVRYALEEERGYDAVGELWSPGYFRVDLVRDEPVTLVASTESWEVAEAMSPEEATRAERTRRARLVLGAESHNADSTAGELVLAADQFLITPAGRVQDAARAHAAGEEIRTVIAGYHWFTDWGRDTMISLEGLTLATGRYAEAGYILRTFAYYIRDGLIPNFFPDGRTKGLYHTADATLWFFHAIGRYLDATGDTETRNLLVPKLVDIVEHHLCGTRFGIGVDPSDGLLRQGQEGYQLTWMDAKVGDWVVTPRRGKAVELNALWYNALRLLEGWLRDLRGEDAARPLATHAERVRRAFNERFWHADGGYLYDVVDGENGDDPACRPNQVFAISLEHPVLEPTRWEAVLDVVHHRLLTPLGLRSLAPGHPDYKPRYFGDLRARDAAYHQGTVWAWLIGPFIDAWLKVHPDDRTGARRFLEGFVPHLNEACVGSISEVFDAEPPYTPRGCLAQAWSVAEVLRCWIKTADKAGSSPDGRR